MTSDWGNIPPRPDEPHLIDPVLDDPVDIEYDLNGRPRLTPAPPPERTIDGDVFVPTEADSWGDGPPGPYARQGDQVGDRAVSMTPEMVRIMATSPGSVPADEPLLSATSGSMPKGDEHLDPRKMSKASGFPLDSSVFLGITPARIIVWKQGFNHKAGKVLGTVDIARISDIEIVWNKKVAVLAIGLVDAPPVLMRSPDSASAEHFRLAFLRLRGRA